MFNGRGFTSGFNRILYFYESSIKTIMTSQNKLIFGSAAALHWFGDFPRQPKDTDYISREDIMTRTEQHYWVPTFEYILENNKDNKYVDPEFLYNIKLSHAGFDIHWQKTMTDILFFKKKGLKTDKDLYKRLMKDWTAKHGARWARLDGKTSTSFFEDAVVRKWDHDSVHQAVANYDEPLYFRILKEQGKVACCENKFELLSYEDKIKLVKEEVWVTALERYLVPANFEGVSFGASYMKSLKKLCTTMSAGGWFKLFLLDNYHNLVYDRDTSYIERFKTAEQKGLIKRNEINNKAMF